MRENIQILGKICDNVHIDVRKTLGVWRKNVRDSEPPKACFHRVIKHNFNVCHNSKCHNFITLPRNTKLFWVLLFLNALTSVCPRCLKNEHVKKKLFFPAWMENLLWNVQLGKCCLFSCRHALSWDRFWLRAEVQLICLIRSRAQELKSCCSLLVWFLCLATDPSRTEKTASCPSARTASSPPAYTAYIHCARDFYVLLCLASFVKTQKQNKPLWTPMRTGKRKPEEVEALDVILLPSVPTPPPIRHLILMKNPNFVWTTALSCVAWSWKTAWGSEGLRKRTDTVQKVQKSQDQVGYQCSIQTSVSLL